MLGEQTGPTLRVLDDPDAAAVLLWLETGTCTRHDRRDRCHALPDDPRVCGVQRDSEAIDLLGALDDVAVTEIHPEQVDICSRERPELVFRSPAANT
jgi:hypothetical protein